MYPDDTPESRRSFRALLLGAVVNPTKNSDCVDEGDALAVLSHCSFRHSIRGTYAELEEVNDAGIMPDSGLLDVEGTELPEGDVRPVFGLTPQSPVPIRTVTVV